MGNAIQAQILQIEGTAAPDDYDRLSQWWLRRQYDIAIQQHSFDEHTLINISPDAGTVNKNSIFSDEELRTLEQNLPSEYQPFEGLRFPPSANQFRPSDDKNKSKKEASKTLRRKMVRSVLLLYQTGWA